MSAAETEEEAPPPQKKSIFSCLTNLPGVCVPQKSAEGEEPATSSKTPKSKSPTSVASKFAALSPYNRKRKQEEQAAKEHEETRLRDQFRRVDTDHSGKVDRHELKFLLNRVTGSTPTEDELDEMMAGVDTSGDGLIDFEEFRGIHQKAKSGELRFAELSRVLTEFDELVGLLDDDDLATEEQSAQKKPRLKSPMSLFSHKKKEGDATTPKPAKKSPMASMKAKFSFGKKKQHDEAEEVEEASEAEEDEPAGPSESLETREQASHKTPAKTPAKSPPLPARPSTSAKKSPPLPPRPSSPKKTDVPAPVVVEETATIPAAPASTPDGPRKSGAMLDDESDSDEEAAPEGEEADRVGPLSPLTPAPEPTPQKTVEDDIAAESVTSFSP
mmetsp:Transcript_6887/g.20498  ORF Transcript_6887/g.20498 Transcript_6887/m.20498 type:complete len:386 (-) Transcript_6887:47-1204(-)